MQNRPKQLTTAASFSGVYSRAELATYFDTLNTELKAVKNSLHHRVGLTFSTSKKSIHVIYSPARDAWLMKNEEEYQIIPAYEISRAVAYRFGSKDKLSGLKQSLVLGTTVKCNADDENVMNRTMLNWMTTDAWMNMHAPTHEKANFKDVNKEKWLKAAVRMGEPELVTLLHDLMWFYKKNPGTTVFYGGLALLEIGGIIAGLALLNPVVIACFLAALVTTNLIWKDEVSDKDKKRIKKALNHQTSLNLQRGDHADLHSIASIVSKLSNRDRADLVAKLRMQFQQAEVPVPAAATEAVLIPRVQIAEPAQTAEALPQMRLA